MAYSIDPTQDNCYPGTTVLVNKLHIHDEAALQEAETLATYVNASKLEQCPLEGVFDFAYYKAFLILPTTRRFINSFSLTCTIRQGRSAR